MNKRTTCRPGKTTWTTNDGAMLFFLPEPFQAQASVPATTIDNPSTLCHLVDIVLKSLSTPEVAVLVDLLTKAKRNTP